MTRRGLQLALLLGLCAGLLQAQEKKDYAQVSLNYPGDGKHAVSRDQLVILVVDGPVISSDGTPVSESNVIPLVNGLLKQKGVSVVGLYVRTGSKYGDVMHAVDLLRKTDAKSIGVSVVELPLGREP